MDFDRILPNLFIGSCPEYTEDITRLKRDFGVTAILSVQTNDDFDNCGICWERMLACYQRLGVEVRRVPVRDDDFDNVRRMLPECVGVLDELLRGDHTGYVHCNAGLNRSPTIVIAYLCWIGGSTVEQAIDYIVQRHPCDPYVDAISFADGGGDRILNDRLENAYHQVVPPADTGGERVDSDTTTARYAGFLRSGFRPAPKGGREIELRLSLRCVLCISAELGFILLRTPLHSSLLRGFVHQAPEREESLAQGMNFGLACSF